MKEIQLTKGKVTLVDDEDYEWLCQWRWTAMKHRDVFVVKRGTIRGNNGKYKCIFMHNTIINPPNGMYVDHINRDGLNNQKSNLRICTASQNMCNRRKFKNGHTSIYKGVAYNKRQKSFIAYITLNNHTTHLGYFKIEEEAARAYDVAAKKYHGEFANLNFKE